MMYILEIPQSLMSQRNPESIFFYIKWQHLFWKCTWGHTADRKKKGTTQKPEYFECICKLYYFYRTARQSAEKEGLLQIEMTFVTGKQFLLECDFSSQFTPRFWLCAKVSASVFLLQKPTLGVMRKKKGNREKTTKAGRQIEWRAAYKQRLSLIEFYELQTCWNGVLCVCSSSYRLAGSRAGEGESFHTCDP